MGNLDKITIRPTRPDDMERVGRIYAAARSFMRSRGNHSQWSDTYPSLDSLAADMAVGSSYVCVDEHDTPVATFFFSTAGEPTYASGPCRWLNNDPYGVIHRVASDGSHKHIMRQILDFCSQLCPNLRIDTHRLNDVMRSNLLQYGFTYCGIIYLASGDERLAYQLERIPQELGVSGQGGR